MIQMTERQKETLQWIVAYIQVNLRPPTVQEVADRFGIKHSSAFQQVRALQKKGFLSEGDGTARSLTPTSLAEGSDACIDLKLRRLAPSSTSIAAVRGFSGAIRPALRHGGNRPYFLVEVRGNSMLEAGIFDGDSAIVRQQDTAEDGDIVIASVDFEALIRRIYYDDSGNALLMPENKSIESMTVAVTDLVLHGKVIGIYRDIG